MEETGKLTFYPPQEMQGICIGDNCQCENTKAFEFPCQYRPRSKDIVKGSIAYNTTIIFSLCNKHKVSMRKEPLIGDLDWWSVIEGIEFNPSN